MSAPRPTAVRWIVALTHVRIALGLVAIGASLYFLSPADSGSLEAFRRGWVRASGFSVDEYGPEQAGEVAGAALVPVILSILLLVFVAKRKLKALRVMSIVALIMTWTQPLLLPFALATVVLAHRQSTRDYCEGALRTPTMTRRPAGPRRPATTHP